MSPVCGAPDPTLGVAVRLAAYLDCQGRSLGENGFLALAGGPIGTSLLTGLVTIFIALIGYRLILGHMPTMRDGVSWSVRLGVVLALVTSWPAFQTLAYRTVVDGPAEIAAVILPASGLPSEQLDGRVQQAYDTIRLGVMDGQPAPAAADPTASAQQTGQIAAASQQIHFQSPLPNTASMLVIFTSGFSGILKIALGFLLAIAPIAMMSLLFDATLGLFNGWVRALVGSALAVLGVTIVTAIDLMMVESELARLQAFRIGAASLVIDTQGLTTIVALFALASIIVSAAAMRMGSAIKLSLASSPRIQFFDELASRDMRGPALTAIRGRTEQAAGDPDLPHRAAMIREALVRSVQREQANPGSMAGPETPSRHFKISEAAMRTAERDRLSSPISRRGLGMKRRGATRRDKRA